MPIAPWRRGAYRLLAALLLVALGFNLAARNVLWAWYTVVGMMVLSTLMLLDRRLAWHIPTRALLWAGVPMAMHYLGGSLSGLHQVGGPNGLYWAFPWWDNVVHFLGAGAAAVMVSHLLAAEVPRRATRIAMAVACASVLGAAVEFYEFLNFAWFGTIDQGYYTNTMLDLYYNTLGAAAFAWAYEARPPVAIEMADAPTA